MHLGHLLVAEAAREAAGLDQVRFVPVARSPFKPDGPLASDRQRLEMLRLALAGHPAFEACDLEIQRAGVSYTVDTLSALSEQNPQASLFLITGSDSASQLHRWKDARRICQLAIPLVAARQGSPFDPGQLADLAEPSRLEEIRRFSFAFPIIELSSTDVRERLANGQGIRYRVPRSVECYIENARLYQTGRLPNSPATES